MSRKRSHSVGGRPKGSKGKKKMGIVLGEFKRGTLRSGSGQNVKNKKQALAIALSEARKHGVRIPKKRKGKKKFRRSNVV